MCITCVGLMRYCISSLPRLRSSIKVQASGDCHRYRPQRTACCQFFSHSALSRSSLAPLQVAFPVFRPGTLLNINSKLSAIKSRPSYRTRRKCFSLVSTAHRLVGVYSVEHADLWKAATEYASDNEHAFVSSSEVSACSVEPGSAQDVGLIVRGSNNTVDLD